MAEPVSTTDQCSPPHGMLEVLVEMEAALFPPDVELIRLLHKAHNGYHPDIWLVTWQGRLAVLKDYRKMRFGVRWLWGAFLMAREEKFHLLLQDLEGIPAFLGRVGRWCNLFEYVEGTVLSSIQAGQLSDGFFDRLTTLVTAMHARGIAHGDLKARRNIIVGQNEKPYLIDFVSAIQRGGRCNLLRNWLCEQARRADCNGLAKTKKLMAPHLLSEEDVHGLEHPTFMEKQARRLRRWFHQ